jgi:hypothetical protein
MGGERWRANAASGRRLARGSVSRRRRHLIRFLVEEGTPVQSRCCVGRQAAGAASSVSASAGHAARRVERAMPRRRAARPVTAMEEEPGGVGPVASGAWAWQLPGRLRSRQVSLQGLSPCPSQNYQINCWRCTN